MIQSDLRGGGFCKDEAGEAFASFFPNAEKVSHFGSAVAPLHEVFAVGHEAIAVLNCAIAAVKSTAGEIATASYRTSDEKLSSSR